MSNKSLATANETAVHKGSFEKRKGFCSRFAREASEVVYGTKYNALWRGDGSEREATAAKAAHRFLAAGLGFLYVDRAKHGGLQAGDIGFKTRVAPNRWGDFSGHVGTLCMDLKRWAENSSTSIGRVRGALGFRTLAQWGAPDIIVRLPDPNIPPVAPPKIEPEPEKETALLVWNGTAFPVIFDVDGRPHIRLAELLEKGKHYVAATTDRMDQHPPRYYLNSEPIPQTV